jgi:hypothetical protein
MRPRPSKEARDLAELPAELRAGLRILLQAFDHADKCSRDPWDFAVEIADLRSAGLAAADLRMLFCLGYVAHAIDKTKPGAKRRLFRTPGGLVFADKTCFILTPTGADTARALQVEAAPIQPEPPFYDRDLRELWFGKELVKCYGRPAPDQETILSTFEDDNWPRRIDNPLSPRGCDDDTKMRLHHTIRRLNQHQIHALILFHADGTGEGIRWEDSGRDAR